MLIFDEGVVEEKLSKYYPLLTQFVRESFYDYQKIPASDGVEYSGIARAVIVHNKIKDKIIKSPHISEDFLKEKINTFLLCIEEINISFNKLDENKRKSKDSCCNSMDINYSFNQLQFQLEDMPPLGENLITEETPLTIGYVLNSTKTDISGIYITYQVGKTVKWYKKLDDKGDKMVLIQGPQDPEKLPHKKRVKPRKDKTDNKINIIDIKPKK